MIVPPAPVHYRATIQRDAFGVPTIVARTDAEAVFGLMVAQAEDNYAQLERDTLATIGRLSEVEGERAVSGDLRVRAFRLPALAQEAYRTSPPGLRKLADAYAAGLNWYLEHRRPSHRIERYEPWFFMAGAEPPNAIDGIVAARNEAPQATDPGSNAWAIAPSRTQSGRAVLFANPHVGLFGRGQRYECRLESGEGWRFAGFCILGNPIPHAGQNGRLGWSHTNTGADAADAYVEDVQDGRYRVGSEWHPLQEWSETLIVSGKPRTYRLRATEHGPLLGRTADGRPVAFRFPVERAVRVWQQKFAMGRARNFREFERALDMRLIVGSNTTYADADGHIAFWYGNLVPERDPAFDWSKPVDGTDPRTAWRGVLPLSRLPRTIDPPSGFVQNCNSDPWHTSTEGNPDPKTIPPYVVRDIDTSRAQNSRRLLAGTHRFSWDELQALAFDTHVFTADVRVPMILAGADPNLKEPLEALRAWDRRSGIHSVGATLYFETELDLLGQGFGGRRTLGGGPEELGRAFGRTVARLTEEFGTWQVPWGLMNRLRRTGGGPEWPVAGAPSVFGQIFAFGYPYRTGGIHYGVEGNTFVALTEFGPTTRSLTLCGMGQSADPASPHFLDQAPLYALGRFRPLDAAPVSDEVVGE